MTLACASFVENNLHPTIDSTNEILSNRALIVRSETWDQLARFAAACHPCVGHSTQFTFDNDTDTEPLLFFVCEE